MALRRGVSLIEESERRSTSVASGSESQEGGGGAPAGGGPGQAAEAAADTEQGGGVGGPVGRRSLLRRGGDRGVARVGPGALVGSSGPRAQHRVPRRRHRGRAREGRQGQPDVLGRALRARVDAVGFLRPLPAAG